jgi:gas vesicle protein
MSDAYVVGFFALAGSALGFIGALLIANRTAKTEERKHFREIGLQVAFHMAKQEEIMAQKLADLTGEIKVTPPMSAWVVHSLKMMEIVSDTSLTSTEVGKRLSELNKFTESVINELRSRRGR